MSKKLLRPLKELVTISKGKKASSVINQDQGQCRRYLQITDLRNDNSLQYTTDLTGVETLESDIIIAWDGANAGTIGYGLNGIIGSTLARLRPTGTEELWTPYIGRFLQTKFSLLNSMSAGATIPHISRVVLENLHVPIPPLTEQKRIAAILDEADTLRRKRREAIAKLDMLLQSVFLEMFGDPVTNPKGYPMMTLGELMSGKGDIVDGPFGSSLKPEVYVKSGIRVIRNFNIEDDRFDDSEYKFVTPAKFAEISRSEVIAGDVLISTKGTVGNVCLMPELLGQSVLSASGTVRMRLPNENVIRREFLVSQMIRPTFKQYIKSFQAGSIQKYLNLSGIRQIALVVPPREAQDKYCEGRSLIQQEHIKMSDGLLRIETLFAALQHQAFSTSLTGTTAEKMPTQPCLTLDF